MRVLVFLNGLGQGGTEKAACRWAIGLKVRGYHVSVLTLKDGIRRAQLEQIGIETQVAVSAYTSIVDIVRDWSPDVIHAHVPGYSHPGDVLGRALARLPKIPVVQTNVFGRLDNPAEEAWTDFRLFISWTSCVQALRRASLKLDRNFFRRASVAAYPLDRHDGPSADQIEVFRRSISVNAD